MKNSFFLAGRLPSLNDVILANRTNRYAGAAQKKKLEQSLAWQIREADIEPLEGCHAYHFIWHEPNRRRDPDNIASAVKFVFDAMIGAGIIENDGWEQVTSISHAFIVSDEVGVEVGIGEY